MLTNHRIFMKLKKKNEIISLIYFIKFYGWKLLFRKIIKRSYFNNYISVKKQK